MREWLTKHGIAYDDSDLKVKNIKDAKPTKQFETDVIADKFTHKVLRLTVAHPELNPIELAWSVVKGYVAKHNQKFTLKEVKALVLEAINTVTPATWRKFAITPRKLRRNTGRKMACRGCCGRNFDQCWQ